MAAPLITYADKVEVNVPSGAANEIWKDDEQNEIKTVVNSQALDIDANKDKIDLYLLQQIMSVETATTGRTLTNNDFAKLIRCDNSSDFTFTYGSLNLIPQNSMLYIQRIGDGEVTVEFDVSLDSRGVKFDDNTFRIELKGGVIAIYKYAAYSYILFGNLKLPE